jgi:hypothetical protein
METPKDAAIPSDTPSFFVCVSIFNGIVPAPVREVNANAHTENTFLHTEPGLDLLLQLIPGESQTSPIILRKKLT